MSLVLPSCFMVDFCDIAVRGFMCFHKGSSSVFFVIFSCFFSPSMLLMFVLIVDFASFQMCQSLKIFFKVGGVPIPVFHGCFFSVFAYWFVEMLQYWRLEMMQSYIFLMLHYMFFRCAVT